MRIVFLLTQSLDSPGGGGRFFPIAKALVKLGHQVTLIALHHDYANCRQRKFLLDGVNVHYVAQMHVRKSGNQKHYFSTPMLLWVVFWATLQLTFQALKTPCDALHICKAQPMNGLTAWIVHFVKRTPIYLESDDLEAAINKFAAPWQEKVVRGFENWLVTFVNGITAHATYIVRHYESLGFPREKIVLVSHGIDTARFQAHVSAETLAQQLGLANSDKVIVYIGSISLHAHALDLLLISFKQVLMTAPTTKLVIVGGGEDFEIVRALVTAMQLDYSVIFTGQIARDEVPSYYPLGLVSVDPRRRSLASETTLSLKIFESIAMGVPVISADIGDRRQAVGDAGVVVEPDSTAALAQAILQILQNPALHAQYCEAAMLQRESNDWDHRIQAFIRVYNQPLL